MEVQAGEGQEHVAEGWHRDALGSAQDVLGAGGQRGKMKVPCERNPPAPRPTLLIPQGAATPCPGVA